MTSEQFAYWLQGFVEVSDTDQPTPHEWQVIRDHLKTVFVKVTPDYNIKGTPYFESPKLVDNWPHYPHGPLITC